MRADGLYRPQIEELSAASHLYAQPLLVTSLENCLFYHSMDLPAHGTIDGYWDIRGHESQYLGGVSFANKRVLEIGPASGALTFFMERQGGEVVSVEAAEDYAWEFYWNIPERAPSELAEKVTSQRELMERIKNSYWFSHRVFESKAKVHYGSAYSLPQALGRFDISVISCVLLHNKNPLQILENCARLTSDTVVVVEPFRETQLAQSPAEFLPTAVERLWHTWWGFSPIYFVDILRSMGFSENRVRFHRQLGLGTPADLFTVVASRNPLSDASLDKNLISAEVTSPIQCLTVEVGTLINVPVSIVNKGAAPLSSSAQHPIVLSYHWCVNSGEPVVWDGLRTVLPRTLYRDDRENLLLSVRVPAEPGIHMLEISLLAEHLTWYDDKLPGLPLRIETVVTNR
jgi:SAM-dependent methyltransferase